MVINIFGRRGSGKTTTIRGNIWSYRKPVLIIDILGNFPDPQFKQCNSLPQALQELRQAVKNSQSEQTIVLKTSDPTLAAEYFSSAIWKIEGGTLVIDEVDSIRMREGSCFDEYIRYGRNHNGDLITGCRRPAELDKNITAAANKFYCFGTHEPRDIEYFRDAVFGERAWELQNLPPYHGLFMDYDKKTWGTFHIDINGNVFHTSESTV